MPRPQQQRSRRTRENILTGAATVIRRDGVQHLSLQRVADEAGVSKGGLLHHFANKEELLLALLARTLSDADDGLEGLVDGAQGPGAFARAYLEYVRVPTRKPLDSATSLFAAMAIDPATLAIAVEQFERWQERLINDDGIPPTTAALARVVGDGLWLIDLFGLAPPSPELREAVIELVLDIVGREAESLDEVSSSN